MSTTKKQRTTGAAADDTPKASSTPIHPWVKLMTEHNMTLEEVVKHTYKVHALEGVSDKPENQAKLEPPTRLKTVCDAPSKAVSVFLKEETEAQTFDYLVVAANPRELMGYGLSTPIGKPDEPTPKVLAPTLKEEAIYGKEGHMYNSYFHTTVIKATPVNPKPTKPPHVILFSPKLNNIATGEVMGYRSETLLAKDHEKTLKDDATVTSEYLTVYQLSDPGPPSPDPLAPKCEAISKEDLQATFDKFIKRANQEGISWFPYKVPEQVPMVFHTPYFNRFTKESLNKGLPWDLLDIQGQNYTTFAHGSSCFESVLQIYQYLDMLQHKGGLPTDKTASVAIVGAGPSGLLSALFLVRKGFRNITIFEKNQEPDEDEKLGHFYAGKTRTVVNEQGAAKSSVVCEMGTCYLSPPYEKMAHDLKDFFDGELYEVDSNVYAEPSVLFSAVPEFEPRFRAMEPGGMTLEGGTKLEGQFRKNGPIMRYAELLGGGLTVPAGVSPKQLVPGALHPFKDEGDTNVTQPINFGEYVILKAMEETCFGPPGWLGGGTVAKEAAEIQYGVERFKCTVELAKDLLKYIHLQKKLFGNATHGENGVVFPFPAERMPPADMKPLTMPFEEWLKMHGLISLKGLFQYAYSVQGYGELDRIPAWYVLMWIDASFMKQALGDMIRANGGFTLVREALMLVGYDTHKEGLVFALKGGWGKVWVNMRKHLVHKGVEFKWSAELERIERDGVKTAK